MKTRQGQRRRGRQTPKNSNTSPKEILVQQKRQEALEYRLQSYTYREIAVFMKISEATAFRLVDSAMKAITRDTAQTVLEMELSKLDLMESSIAQGAFSGDISAQTQVLRIMERRARLLGTDKLGELDLKHKGTGPNGELEVTTSIAIEFVNGQTEDRQ